MGNRARTWRALSGLTLVAALIAVVPGSSTAAPPPGPGYACSTAAKPAAKATKVMIAGDSITNASAGDYTWRYWLWRNLVDRGAKVDFVGRFDDTLDARTLKRGNRQYLDCNFDQDHEARPGVKLYNGSSSTPSYTKPAGSTNDATLPSYPGASSWIAGAVRTYQPAILVAFVGTNDVAFPASQGTNAQVAAKAISHLKKFIAQARSGNAGVDIVLTTVPTLGAAKYKLYNKALPKVVKDLSTKASRLVIATMPDWSKRTWDGLHPNANGEVAIAAVVNDALHRLTKAFPPKKSPLQKPRLGPRVRAELTAAGAGSGKVRLTWTLPPGADRTIVYARNVTGKGGWIRRADLVLSALKSRYKKVGTATCQGGKPCTTFTVGGLSGGTTYAFQVRSAKGLAVATDLVSNVRSVTATGPLGKVAAGTPTAGVRKVSVRWTALGGVTGYEVRWRKAGKSWSGPAAASTTPRVISGLVAKQRYGFQVRARNGSATGAWSTEVFATPKAR